MSFSDIEFKATSGTFNIDQAQGIVECFVAGVGNKDSVGDVLLPGAFNGSLKRRKPRVVWGHNWNDPIGKVLEIYEVPATDPRLPQKMKSAGIGGLYARVQFNLNSEKGREAFANVAFFGEEQEWSIGYKTIQATFDPNLQANILKEVELYEVSPVLHGANQLTGTISVKSDTAVLDDAKGHGMVGMMPAPAMMPSPGMPSGMMKPMPPKPQQAVKPVRPSIPENPLMVALRRELVKRSGSNVIVRTVTDSIVIFDRLTSDGQSSTYRVAYHFEDGDFMFGRPERVQAQTVYSPAAQENRTPMQSFDVSVKPQADAYVGDDPDEFISMPGKSEDFEFSDFFEDIQEKVGRALNNRNLSKLKTVMEMLQEIVATAEKEKEVEVKEYIIPVDIKNAFHTKQLLDPIMDYHRVDAHVSEKGIVVTSGITPEFIDAVETLKKSLGRRIAGGGGKGKARRLARGAASNFDPKAWDGDGDGLVQEGTPFQRPAIPGVNDQASRGRGMASMTNMGVQGMDLRGLNDVDSEKLNFGAPKLVSKDSFKNPSDLVDRHKGTNSPDDKVSQAIRESFEQDAESAGKDLGFRALIPRSAYPKSVQNSKREGWFRGAEDAQNDMLDTFFRDMTAADIERVLADKDSQVFANWFIQKYGDAMGNIRLFEDGKGQSYRSDPDFIQGYSERARAFMKSMLEDIDEDSPTMETLDRYFVRQQLDDTSRLSQREMDRTAENRRSGMRSSTPSGMRSSTEDSMASDRSRDRNNIEVLDSQIMQHRMSGNSIKETAELFNMPEEQVRRREIAEMKRLREEGDTRDMVAYRLNGLSLRDTAKLFGTTPEKVRDAEMKELRRLRKDASDMDISDYRNRGVSLETMAELLNTTRQDIRRREMRPVPPDPPLTDDQLRQMARDYGEDDGDDKGGMRSSTFNPRPLTMSLSNDEIGELRDEIPMLKRYSSNPKALDAFDEKLKKAKNGKIELTSQEAQDLEAELNSIRSRSEGEIATIDSLGVLDQTIESADGKYVSPNWEEQKRGGRGDLGMRSKTPNNGAPPQIDEARQKKLVFFMNSADGGRLGIARRIREQYAQRGDGTMPAKDWKALNTLYGNITGDKLPIETERFRDGGMRSSTEESMGRDRGPGISVSGIGDVSSRERGTRGRRVGGGEDGVGTARFKGKNFNEMKPENWDEMSTDDKFEWMFSNSPERTGMRQADYNREMEKLLKEEGVLEERESRRQGLAQARAERAERASAGEEAKPSANPNSKDVSVKPRPDNEKDARAQRKDDYSKLEKFVDRQISDVTRLDEKGRVDQMHVDAWDEIGTIMDSDDLTKNQINAAIQRLKNYLEDANEADETEGSAEKLVESARKLLRTMQSLKTYYGKDEFIEDGPELNVSPRSGAAGRGLADISDEAFDIDSSGGMRSRVPVNADKVVSSNVKNYVASRRALQNRSGMRSTTSNKKPGRTEIKEEATFFKYILDSLPKEISEARKANDRKTSAGLEKLQSIINRQEAAKLGDRRTNAGRILVTQDEVDEILDAIMMVIDRQGASGGGERQQNFAKFIDMLAKAAMSTFIDRTVEELGGRTQTRRSASGRSVEIQDL